MAQNARTRSTPINIWTRLYAQLKTASSTMILQIFGVFSSHEPPQFNAVDRRCYLFDFARVQYISYFNQTTAFIIPVLITFLQLKYQGSDKKTPFSTHPTTMLVAVSSSVAYYLAYAALLQFPRSRFAAAAYRCFVVFAYTSVASLSSVFFRDSFRPYFYAVFVLVLASDLLCWLYHKLVVNEDSEFQIYRRSWHRLFNSIIWRALANSSGRRPQILPV